MQTRSYWKRCFWDASRTHRHLRHVSLDACQADAPWRIRIALGAGRPGTPNAFICVCPSGRLRERVAAQRVCTEVRGHIGVASTTSGQLRPVFDTIAGSLAGRCGRSRGPPYRSSRRGARATGGRDAAHEGRRRLLRRLRRQAYGQEREDRAEDPEADFLSRLPGRARIHPPLQGQRSPGAHVADDLAQPPQPAAQLGRRGPQAGFSPDVTISVGASGFTIVSAQIVNTGGIPFTSVTLSITGGSSQIQITYSSLISAGGGTAMITVRGTSGGPYTAVTSSTVVSGNLAVSAGTYSAIVSTAHSKVVGHTAKHFQ